MATYEEVMSALRNADAAGHSDDAKRLAVIAESLKPKAEELGSPTHEDQPIAPYLFGRFKEGLAAVPKLAGAVTDILSDNPDVYAPGLQSGEKFPITQAITEAAPKVLNYDPNAPVPTNERGEPKFSAKMLGNVAEFAGGNAIPGTAVAARAARPLVALAKEGAGVLAAGVGQTEGEAMSPKGYESVGSFVGSMIGPASLQGLIEGASKGGNWVKGTGDAAIKAEEAGKRKAAEELRPQLESPVSKTNLEQVADLSKKVPGLADNVTLGQVTDSPTIKSLERHYGTTNADALELAQSKRTGLSKAISTYVDKRFPTPDDANVGDALKATYDTKIKRLDDATERLTSQQKELADKYQRGDMEQVGDDIRNTHARLMSTAKQAADERYKAVYAAATKSGVSVNMGDVESLAKNINNEAGRAFQNDPGVVGKILAKYGDKVPEQQYQVTEYGRIPVDVPPQPKVATFEEFHSLYKEAGRESSELSIAAKMGNSDAAQKLREVNKVRDLLKAKVDEMESPQYGEVGKLLKDANSFYKDKYASLFKSGVGGEIGKKNRFGVSTEDSKLIPRLIFKKGDASGIEEYISMAQGDKQAYSHLKDGVMDTFAKAVTKDGKIDPKAVANFMRDYKEPLEYLPVIKNKISSVEGAAKSLAENKQRVIDEQKAYSASVVKSIAKTEKPETIITNALNSPKQLKTLLESTSDVGEKQAIARGMIDQISKQSNPEDYLIKHGKQLETALGTRQFAYLKTIMSAQKIANRVEAPTHLQFEKLDDPLAKLTGTSIPQAVSEFKSVTNRFASPEYAGARIGIRWWNRQRNEARDKVLMDAIYNPETAEALSKYLSNPTSKYASLLNPHLIPYGIRAASELQQDATGDSSDARAKRKAQRTRPDE